MGLLTSLLSEKRSMTVYPGEHPSKFTSFLGGLFVSPTTSGINVNEHSAFTLSAYWCRSTRFPATWRSFPSELSRRSGISTRASRRASRIPVERAAESRLDPRHISGRHSCRTLWAGATRARESSGTTTAPAALWPLLPNETTVDRDRSGRVVYLVSSQRKGKPTTLYAEDVIHVPGLGFDGLCGYSVAKMARESLGLSIAAEKYGGTSSEAAGRQRASSTTRASFSMTASH